MKFSREQAEKSFKAFGNLFLKTCAVQERYGYPSEASPEALRAGFQELDAYLEAMPLEDLKHAHDFALYMTFSGPLLHDILCRRMQRTKQPCGFR